MKLYKLYRGLLIVLLSICSYQLSMRQAVIGPELEGVLNTMTEPIEVIVTFYGDDGLNAQEIQLLNTAGITTGFTFQSLPMAGVLASKASIESLSASAQVRSIYLNKKLTYMVRRSSKIVSAIFKPFVVS
ncbi:MAG: hypothetical protein FH748_07305 [Balneolaceae bacterium]|nr:hypothetical protein [Balneolaceae bacterium]